MQMAPDFLPLFRVQRTWRLARKGWADLPPEAPSFITRVCRLGFHILRRQFGQARRERSRQIAQALDARQRVFGCPSSPASDDYKRNRHARDGDPEQNKRKPQDWSAQRAEKHRHRTEMPLASGPIRRTPGSYAIYCNSQGGKTLDRPARSSDLDIERCSTWRMLMQGVGNQVFCTIESSIRFSASKGSTPKRGVRNG